jgi:hypothetical protein
MILAAILVRAESTDAGTFGTLIFNATTVHTLELPWRDNQRKISCIPPGSYVCRLVNSPKFGRVYGVTNVPGRGNILIHSANLAGDSSLGYTTQLEGCIAPCMRIGMMRNKAGNMQRAGLVSRPALRLLTDWANGQPFILEIK